MAIDRAHRRSTETGINEYFAVHDTGRFSHKKEKRNIVWVEYMNLFKLHTCRSLRKVLLCTTRAAIIEVALFG